MAKVWQRYTKDIYAGMRYLPSWPPSARAEVGDVGILKRGTLERQMSIGDLGLPMTTIDGAMVGTRGWASSKAVVVSPGVAAAAPVHPGLSAAAELKVRFEGKHEILLRVERSRERSLDRLDLLKRELLRLHDEGRWERDWILVTKTIRAQRQIALIANRKGASADLRLSGGLAQDAGGLATVGGELTVASSSEMAYSETEAEGTTPLYLAIRVQKRVARDNRVKRVGRRGRARGGEAEFEVSEVTF